MPAQTLHRLARLGRPFFRRRSLSVARALLGKTLWVKSEKTLRGGVVTEVEAYPGPFDRASHAFQMKRTERNEAEYREGGFVYIYLVYGMHWQLNISTGKEGYPECVLIRALEPYHELKTENLRHKTSSFAQAASFAEVATKAELKDKKNLTNGPGKLCRFLRLDKSFYGEDVTRSKRIWFTHERKISRLRIQASPRIGIDYAGAYWAGKPWRFVIS